MISPISGSTLGTTNVKFTWGGEAGVTAYELILGTTGFGSHDLYNSGLITATTATVSSIPANLATVYARLCSKISGVLSCNNYSYTEAGTPIPATMTSPTGGSTLGTTNVKFTWTSGAGATAYELILGTTGFGSHDLYNSGLITATTATISSLPANAVTVYARLCSKISGVLSCNNYTYTEQ
jgi:TM2 domain-containing membrane protein YozV